MKAIFFNLLHKITGVFAKIMGYIYMPYSRKYFRYNNVITLTSILQEGDIIVDRTNGELSTLLIPGFYKHAAIYIGNGKIIDATHIGVQERYLADLIMTTDNVAILRVIDITKEQQKLICEYIKSNIGTPYDFEINIETKKKIYCSELVYLAVNYAKQQEYLDLRESMGIKTITPQDLYLAKKKLAKIWEKRENNNY